MKIQEIAKGKYVFYCLACQELHQFDDTWLYNNDPKKPTVFPCILNKLHHNNIGPRVKGGPVVSDCGLFIMDGYLNYYRSPRIRGFVRMVDVQGTKPLDIPVGVGWPKGMDRAVEQFRTFQMAWLDSGRNL